MDERTRTELELLSRWYVVARSSTLRLLRDLDDDEWSWQPCPGCPSLRTLFIRIALTEDVRIQRRLAGRNVVPDAIVAAYRNSSKRKQAKRPLARDEVGPLLKRLKTATLGFIRGLLFGRCHPCSPDVLAQMQFVIFHELNQFGQMQYLRGLRLAARRERG